MECSTAVPQSQSEVAPAPDEWQFQGHAAIRDGRCRLIGQISETVDGGHHPAPPSGSSIPRQ
jgi:hypothetical protein